MNKVYFFISDEDCGGVYVGAPTWKEAHKHAWGDPIIYENAESYVSVHGNVCKGKNTPVTGVMDTQEICDAGVTWWDCPGEDPKNWCGSQDFEIINNSSYYRCRTCGHVGAVPYMEV